MRRLMVLAVFIVSVQTALPQSRSADEAALRAQVAAFESSVNKRNIPGVGALYAADADVIMNDAPVVTGRVAIQTATQRDWGSASPARRITLSITGIRFVGPNVAIVNTRAQISEGPVKEDRGTWVMAKQADGKWLINALRVMPMARQ